jgi:enoyl-CoA hydratase/carnithine racemase
MPVNSAAPEPVTFRYEESDAIATITLDRPDKLNALTFDMYAELRDTFAALRNRREVRAVVMTGSGRGFCSGGDVDDIIGPLIGRDIEQLLAFTRMTGGLIRNIRACPQPVVAALNGLAAGAGAVIALAADFRIGHDQSSFSFLFTKVGLAGADMGAAYLLPRFVGLARATELLFLGERLTAAEAHAIGLINRIVAADAVYAEARALAARLCAGPSFALGMTKQLLNQELDLDFRAAIEAEAEGQAICMQTRNFKEFYDAFRAKRAPRYD